MASDARQDSIPSFLFSADQHSGHDRFGAWQHEVSQLFEAAPVEDVSAFEGVIGGHLLDGIVVALTEFSGQDYRRDRRLVARTGLDAYLVQLYTEGGFNGYADTKEMSVTAGDVCVFDMTDTLATQAVQSKTVSLIIPKLAVDSHWSARASVNGLVIPGRTALGQLMGAHLAALGGAMPDMTQAEAPVIATTTAQIVASCLAYCTSGDGMENGALQQALYTRAMQYIRGNLRSRDLSPDAICTALRVSRPHLYRAFTNKGGVVHNILEQRLKMAFNELSDPANRNETIGSIAFRCGFESDSHFNRLFRQVFGVRPTDARDAPRMAPASTNGEPSLSEWLSTTTFAGA